MPSETSHVWCCGCGCKVDARLTNGREIYPHREDLSEIPFWKCDTCGNAVGSHHKSHGPVTPLGCIPTPELKRARQEIHALIDPLWRSGRVERKEIYKIISQKFGRKYHTADLRNLEEARAVYEIAKRIAEWHQ